MIVCIDTNVLLPMLGLRHPLGRLLDAWMVGRYDWAVSNEVITEYEEIVSPRIGVQRWQDFLMLLELGEDVNGNLHRIQPSYRFSTIMGDVDDNKFADCAIAANADWIVTEDKHFNALKGRGFRPQPISPSEFMRMLGL